MVFDVSVSDKKMSSKNLHGNSDLSRQRLVGNVGNSEKTNFAKDCGNGCFSVCGNSYSDCLTNSMMKENEELADATLYVSIIRRMQKKIHVLQEALLTSNQCFSLTNSTEVGGQSTTDLFLEPATGFQEANDTQKCDKLPQRVDADNAIKYLGQLASKVSLQNFNEWTKVTPSRCLDSRSTKQNYICVGGDGHGETKAQDNKGKELGVLGLKPNSNDSFDSGGGSMKALSDDNLFVDPIIVIDITSTMNHVRPGTYMTLDDKERLQMRDYAKEVERLTAENINLRKGHAARQHLLDVKDEEVQHLKRKLNELSARAEKLQKSSDMSKEDCSSAYLCRDAALKMVELAETRCRKLVEECEDARRNAEIAWREVNVLESARRSWELKERELQRLRVLMRFSELKKDSDKLTVVAEQMACMNNECEKLWKENMRCRALLEKYRGRLETVADRAAASPTDGRAEKPQQPLQAPAAKPLTPVPAPRRPQASAASRPGLLTRGKRTVPLGPQKPSQFGRGAQKSLFI